MQYLLMCCADEAQWAKLPDAQRARVMDEYRKLIHDLKTSGRLLAGAQLDRAATAVTVREKTASRSSRMGRSRKPRNNSAATT